jgi:hypothetical protein
MPAYVTKELDRYLIDTEDQSFLGWRETNQDGWVQVYDTDINDYVYGNSCTIFEVVPA